MAVAECPLSPSHAQSTPYSQSSHGSDESTHESAAMVPSIVLTPPVTPPSEAETDAPEAGNGRERRGSSADPDAKPAVLHNAKAEPDASEWKPDSTDRPAAAAVSRDKPPASRRSMAAMYLAKFHRSTTEPGRLPYMSKMRGAHLAQRSISFEDCRIHSMSAGREAEDNVAKKDGSMDLSMSTRGAHGAPAKPAQLTPGAM